MINVHVYPIYGDLDFGGPPVWTAESLEIAYSAEGDTPEEAMELFLKGVRHALPACRVFQPVRVEEGFAFWNTAPEGYHDAPTPGGER